MVKTEIYCDRCGKLIEENNYRAKYRIVENGSLLGLCDNEIDLCDNCQERVDDYIDYTFHEDEIVEKEEKEELVHHGYWKLVKINDNSCGEDRYNFDMICTSCGKTKCSFCNFTEEECLITIGAVINDECEYKLKDDYYPPYCPHCGSKNEVKIDG